MSLIPASPEAYEEAQRVLRAGLRLPIAEVRNTAVAADINAPSLVTFRGTAYKVEALPYRLGLQFHEIHLEIDRLAKLEEKAEATGTISPEAQATHLEQLLACYERAVVLFWEAAIPLAWWKRRRYRKVNPFLDCSQQELGELLGFFFMCRMKSSVSVQGGLMTRPSLSLSTRRMT